MNDSQKIEELLHYFRIRATDFAKKADIGTVQTIYDIQNGVIKISKKVSDKILNAFPEVNKMWLLTGEGNMLKSSTKQSIIGNNNIQGGDNSIVGSNIGNCQNVGGNNGDVPDLVKVLLAEKEERIKEKDERIQELKEVIQNLKEVIRELKSK